MTTATTRPACAHCARRFDADTESGLHAARHWVIIASGLMCRTCQRRERRGELAS